MVLVHVLGGSRSVFGGRGPGYAEAIENRPAELAMLALMLIPAGDGVFAWEGTIAPGSPPEGAWRPATTLDHPSA